MSHTHHTMPRDIVRDWHDELTRLRKIEADARAAGLLDEAGNVRKVLGTLPITRDGCIVGEGAEPLYWVCPTTRRVRSSGTGRVLVDYGEVVPIEHVATTPEAAQAAARGGAA